MELKRVGKAKVEEEVMLQQQQGPIGEVVMIGGDLLMYY